MAIYAGKSRIMISLFTSLMILGFMVVYREIVLIMNYVNNARNFV